MIVLTVLSYNGAPSDGPSTSFDEIGGTIGRAENNQLVLPDPERTISRVHARVVFRGGRYAIVDNGSNPISVNGNVLGSGREFPLSPGDQVQIGGYLLTAAAAGAAAVEDDPFADLFGDAGQGLAAPAAPAAAWPAPVPAPSPASVWASPPPAPAAAWPSPPPSAAWPAPPAAPAAPAGIPEDWDPFADPVTSVRAPAPRGAAPSQASSGGFDDLAFGGPAGSDSLDDLFGLGGAATGGDPLGAPPAQAMLMQPNTAGNADPLKALAKPVSVADASLADDFSDLHMPMPGIPQRPSPPSPPPIAAPAPVSAVPAGAVFSWDEPPRDGRIVTLPGVRPAESAPAPVPKPVPVPAPVSARPAAPAPAAPAAGDAALLAALMDGLAAPGLRIDALTPDLMRLLGQLLHESTRGAVELLVARAALKREMRAEMTMIVARENNPLKFSPSPEVALQHLLGPQSPGFMAPAPAIRDAYDDLRAHQLGVMAGMRAALEGVLQRFDPQQLEGKLTRRSAISSLIPGARKARLWELFQELFTQLSSEAQDDFDELFGKAFLQAYEAQLDRLHNEPGPR